MTNTNRQPLLSSSVTDRMLISGGAGLLILVGLVFQLGTLGFGHVQPGNLWIASTVVQGVWSMLILQLDSPGVHAIATFWPSLLIGVGLAILLVARREITQQVLSFSRGEHNHDR